MARLSEILRVRIPRSLACASIDRLHESGLNGMEGIVLWAGVFDEPTLFDVQLMFRPEQNAYRTETGLLASVSGEEMFRVNQRISDEGMRLLAQLHTHPTDAYHSETDENFALVTARGSISIVIPDFAVGDLDPSNWAVLRLFEHGKWQLLNEAECAELIQIVDDV